jgi:predicted RNA-binding Zn-ribbon protein involved in translation (DUF1610 family)
VTDSAAWRETRIWCPHCGQRRLLGCFSADRVQFALACPGCHTDSEADLLWLYRGSTGYRRALTRVLEWQDSTFRPNVTGGAPRCFGPCRRPVPAQIYLPGERVPWDTGPARFPWDRVPWGTEPARAARNAAYFGARSVVVRCPVCGSNSNSTLERLALATEHGRRFWSRHPRIRALPEREVDVDGRPAIVTSFRSVTGAARLDLVSAADTLSLLAVHSNGA